jgi:Tfp pilus assembly protein PilE
MTKAIRIYNNKQATLAFTIVELLVVIVVIAILAAITIVSYAGITKQATTSSVQSNLKQLATTIDLDHAAKDAYPSTSSAINSGKGFPTTSGITYSYNSLDNNTNYCASATGSGITYHYTPKDGQIKSGDCGSLALSCPSGFIPVPGSSTYSTSDFCVMKYEAKNVAGVATSQAAGLPWVDINQADAATASSAACSGCHLITEAEWMTIAQNVLGVASNWSGGAVGSGYIPRGNSDSSAATDGVTDLTGINKRTLALSNGEAIWDLAGNVWEWTSEKITGGQPGVSGAGYAWREWTAITAAGSLRVNPSPSGTGIAGAGSWNSSNGIGQISSSSDDTTSQLGFFRGGAWDLSSMAGILTLYLSFGPSGTDSSLGFRASR